MKNEQDGIRQIQFINAVRYHIKGEGDPSGNLATNPENGHERTKSGIRRYCTFFHVICGTIDKTHKKIIKVLEIGTSILKAIAV